MTSTLTLFILRKLRQIPSCLHLIWLNLTRFGRLKFRNMKIDNLNCIMIFCTNISSAYGIHVSQLTRYCRNGLITIFWMDLWNQGLRTRSMFELPVLFPKFRSDKYFGFTFSYNSLLIRYVLFVFVVGTFGLLYLEINSSSLRCDRMDGLINCFRIAGTRTASI